MKIDFVTTKLQQNIYNRQKSSHTVPPNNNLYIADISNKDTISFGAKTPNIKKLDLNLTLKKLLNQIDVVLKSDGTLNLEDRVKEGFNRMLRHRQNLEIQVEILQEDFQKFLEQGDKNSPMFKAHARMFLARINNLKKQDNYKVVVNVPTYQEITTDYKLFNLFKNSVNNEHYDLQKVFDNYYKDLSTISTVDELNKKYPKLVTIEYPENIIAWKIMNTLTRDFYEKLDALIQKEDKEGISELIYSAIEKAHDEKAFNKYGITVEEFDDKIIKPFTYKVLDKHKELQDRGSYSAIPYIRKIKTPQITDIDYKLLKANYDDFNLTVFREMYLNEKKFKDIIYKKDGIEIKLSQVKDRYYKIEDIRRNIKDAIALSEQIRDYYRRYDQFDTTALKNRISYYADRIDNNENLLEQMINFMNCRFHDEDRPMLIKFLRELDAVWDGDKTQEEAIKSINQQGLRPVGTEKIKYAERQAALQLKMEEQRLFRMLAQKQEDFDAAMNLLYQNNMNLTAEICEKYRPKSLNSGEIEKSESIINTIYKFRKNRNSEVLTDKEALESHFYRQETFNAYKQNGENLRIFQKAKQYALKSDGTIDTDKAGKYLINHEITHNYPKTAKYYKNPELLDRIMEQTGKDIDAATLYLCKYDDYTDLSPKDRHLITHFSEIFDIKNPVEKIILKNIIENEYILSDSVTKAVVKENGYRTVDATFASKAKKEIYEYYKFPECINFYKAFENALGNRALTKNSSGIKKLFGCPYKFELKILGYPDRLMAKDESYYFDKFDNKGLH